MTASEATTSNQPSSVAEDMLNGAEEIAAFTGDTLRHTLYLLEKRRLPAFKAGRLWRMRKSAYLSYIQQLESVAMDRLVSAAKADMQARVSA